MKRCSAVTPSSSYAPAHQCCKTAGLKLVRGRLLCAHHRAMKPRRTDNPSPSARNYQSMPFFAALA